MYSSPTHIAQGNSSDSHHRACVQLGDFHPVEETLGNRKMPQSRKIFREKSVK